MRCPVCSHLNEGGNFCEECGAKLEQSTYEQVASAVEQPDNFSQTQVNTQPNQYLEEAKNISKMYFRYFIEVIKKPYASSKSVGAEHFVNAIITIVLYSIIIPLMIYFGFQRVASTVNEIGGMFGADTYSPPFTDIVIKPTFAYAIFILLVATYTFISIKLGKVAASYKEVISRFGSFLIPFVAILFIAMILALLKTSTYVVGILFGLGFITSIFIVPALVIASFKKEADDGLDVIYGTLLSYILTIVTLGIMANILFQSLQDSLLNSIFSSF